MKGASVIFLLVSLSSILLSVPFLVPGTGFVALVGFVPLLFAEEVAHQTKMKGFFGMHYLCFLLWNLMTTWWVCNATLGGGIFASLANAFQMSVVFELFRRSRRHLRGSLPYLFLMFAWIAWERWYLTWAQISWPWLVLGNAFARTTDWIQWYEYTGTLGGSLLVWATNLSVSGIIMAVFKGDWRNLNAKARTAAVVGVSLLFTAPPALSLFLRPEAGEGTLDVFIAQPNIDIDGKHGGLTQEEQTAKLLAQFEQAPKKVPALLIGPETFSNDVIMNDLSLSPTLNTFEGFLSERPLSSMLIGASSYDYIHSPVRPSETARQRGKDLWAESHNSALMLSSSREPQVFHKNKLVVGVEMTPYPSVFRPIDDRLGGVMGRCVGTGEASNLAFGSIPVGCAICYESVYGEYCTGYVRKGAELLTIITNDAWWGDTPGYRQHLSYASLRAIETRRWIARCGNTGISAIIDPAGRIVRQTSWWQEGTLAGKVGLSREKTFFVRHGDFIGRLSILMFLLILLGMIVRRIAGQTPTKKGQVSSLSPFSS